MASRRGAAHRTCCEAAWPRAALASFDDLHRFPSASCGVTSAPDGATGTGFAGNIPRQHPPATSHESACRGLRLPPGGDRLSRWTGKAMTGHIRMTTAEPVSWSGADTASSAFATLRCFDPRAPSPRGFCMHCRPGNRGVEERARGPLSPRRGEKRRQGRLHKKQPPAFAGGCMRNRLVSCCVRSIGIRGSGSPDQDTQCTACLSGDDAGRRGQRHRAGQERLAREWRG